MSRSPALLATSIKLQNKIQLGHSFHDFRLSISDPIWLIAKFWKIKSLQIASGHIVQKNNAFRNRFGSSSDKTKNLIFFVQNVVHMGWVYFSNSGFEPITFYLLQFALVTYSWKCSHCIWNFWYCTASVYNFSVSAIEMFLRFPWALWKWSSLYSFLPRHRPI